MISKVCAQTLQRAESKANWKRQNLRLIWMSKQENYGGSSLGVLIETSERRILCCSWHSLWAPGPAASFTYPSKGNHPGLFPLSPWYKEVVQHLPIIFQMPMWHDWFSFFFLGYACNSLHAYFSDNIINDSIKWLAPDKYSLGKKPSA